MISYLRVDQPKDPESMLCGICAPEKQPEEQAPKDKYMFSDTCITVLHNYLEERAKQKKGRMEYSANVWHHDLSSVVQQLRPVPTLPADPFKTDQPIDVENCGARLPALHCAFQHYTVPGFNNTDTLTCYMQSAHN